MNESGRSPHEEAATQLSPLRSWELGNFKSVVKQTVDLRKLTVLVGANSSGKSTLLQSILLMVQAAQEPQRLGGEGFPLNGSLVQLGTFDDLLSMNRDGPRIRVGGTFTFDLETVSSRVHLRGRLQRDPNARRLPVDVSWQVAFEGSYPSEPGSTLWQELSLHAKTVGEFAEDVNLDFEASRRVPSREDTDAAELGQRLPTSWSSLGPYGLRRSPRAGIGRSLQPTPFAFCRGVQRFRDHSTDVFGVATVAGFPTEVLVEADSTRLLARLWVDLVEERAAPYLPPSQRTAPSRQRASDADIRRVVERAAGDVSRWSEAVGAGDSISVADLFGEVEAPTRDLHLPMGLDLEIAEIAGRGKRVLVPRPLHPYIDLGGAMADFLSQHVTYLGPLRQAPSAFYQSTLPARERFVGVRGESTAAVLRQRRGDMVDVPMPLSGRVEHVRLDQALGAWLQELDAAVSVEAGDLPRLGLEMKVRPRGLEKSVDLSAVGVGVSQLVPVVLTCLLWRPGEVILLEQPELHLHPRMQLKLGDFFFACARSGRQLIIETHSEHIISRLRRLIAEDEVGGVEDLIGIVNVNMEEGRTRYEAVRATSLGSLENWPLGFFDQGATEAEAILRAAMKKRAQRAKVQD